MNISKRSQTRKTGRDKAIQERRSQERWLGRAIKKQARENPDALIEKENILRPHLLEKKMTREKSEIERAQSKWGKDKEE